MNYQLTAHEVQSGSDRVRYAEGLIRQLPDNHEGRNTWLLNYGVSDEAVEKRRLRGLAFRQATQAAETSSERAERRVSLDELQDTISDALQDMMGESLTATAKHVVAQLSAQHVFVREG